MAGYGPLLCFGISELQNRYAGDVGDYVKLALLRALAPELKLGVAWYLYPDEGHNSDGRHISYLRYPSQWRHLDPDLFDGLSHVVATSRSVTAIERAQLVDATFAREPLNHALHPPGARSAERTAWFSRLLERMSDREIVFADPDNGLTDDDPTRRARPTFGKHLPLAEARALADGRCAVIYHHNSRFKGGHDAEVDHWRRKLGGSTVAIRATAFSCRTFFIVNGSTTILERAARFTERWSDAKVRMHG